MDRLILASASPRRKELLACAQIPFVSAGHRYEEENHPIKGPALYVEEVSLRKALAADFSEIPKEGTLKWVCAVDTVVYYEGEILGKPKNGEEAERNIRRLSNQTHSVFSGVTLLNLENKKQFTASMETRVKFSQLDENFIQFYLDNRLFEGYAGGYAVQGIFSCVVEKIIGSYSNVVGLPMETLYRIIKQSGFRLYRGSEEKGSI